MKWERAEKVGKDIHLKACIYPDQCGTKQEVHEEAVYGLGYSDSDPEPATATAKSKRIESLVAQAKANMVNKLKARYTEKATASLSFEGKEEDVFAPPLPVPPAPPVPPPPLDFEIRPIGLPYLVEKKGGGQQVEQVYTVFRRGVPKLPYRVVVASKVQLDADVAKAFEMGRRQTLAEEALIDAAKILIGV